MGKVIYVIASANLASNRQLSIKVEIGAPPTYLPPPPQPDQKLPSSARLEEKLDDLVPLLRCQAAEKQARVPQVIPHSVSLTQTSSSTLGEPNSDSSSSMPRGALDVVLDTANSVVNFLRPRNPRGAL